MQQPSPNDKISPRNVICETPSIQPDQSQSDSSSKYAKGGHNESIDHGISAQAPQSHDMTACTLNLTDQKKLSIQLDNDKSPQDHHVITIPRESVIASIEKEQAQMKTNWLPSQFVLPKRQIILAVGLFLVGLVLISVGIAKALSNKNAAKGIGFWVTGVICFLPGAYSTLTAIKNCLTSSAKIKIESQ